MMLIEASEHFEKKFPGNVRFQCNLIIFLGSGFERNMVMVIAARFPLKTGVHKILRNAERVQIFPVNLSAEKRWNDVKLSVFSPKPAENTWTARKGTKTPLNSPLFRPRIYRKNWSVISATWYFIPTPFVRVNQEADLQKHCAL